MNTQLYPITSELLKIQKEINQKKSHFENCRISHLKSIEKKLDFLSEKIQQESPEESQEPSRLLKDIQESLSTMMGHYF